MNEKERDERIRHYLEQACSPIRDARQREEVRAELAGHLEELAADIRGGNPELSEGQAISIAIERMGDLAALGKQLRRIHRPKFEWSLALIALLLLGIGLVALYAFQLANQERMHRSVHSIAIQSIWAAAGAAVLLALLFSGSRMLLSIARPLYWATVLMFLLAFAFGAIVNGQRDSLPPPAAAASAAANE